MHAQPHDPPTAAPIWELQQVTGRGESEILRVADLQKGLIAGVQLRAAGLGRGAVAYRVRRGRLHVEYRGVYRVDRRLLEPLAAEMAAVLAYPGHAVISHRSAAVAWELLEERPPEITLTLVAKDRVARAGLRVHRVKSLDHRDLRLHEGLPVTSPARTVVDLAATESAAELEQVLAIAQARNLASAGEIRAAVERVPGRKGATSLARLLESGDAGGFTRSSAERRMRALLRKAELPQPQANVPLLGYVVDFLWPQRMLIVEVDGFAFHSSRSSFERDRRRDQKLTALGYAVVRVTWRQLTDEPLAVIARIAQALTARAA